jgi:hypothetical protein
MIVAQMVMKFPVFYRTRRFITGSITAHHRTQTKPIYTLVPCLCNINYNIILPSMPRSSLHVYWLKCCTYFSHLQRNNSNACATQDNIKYRRPRAYIYTYITYMNTYIRTYIHTYVRTYIYIHTYIHTCTHACMHAYIRYITYTRCGSRNRDP